MTSNDPPPALYNPASFDPLEALPDALRHRADDARWLVHALYQRRVFDRRGADGWVNLKAAYLRRYMNLRDYHKVVNALEAGGVIEVDRHYVPGVHSRAYRLAARYRGERHRRVGVAARGLARTLARDRAALGAGFDDPVHRHLCDNLRRLEIDLERAERDGVLADPAVAHQAACLGDGAWHFSVDDYGRVHTNLSNLKKCLRKYLRVDGQPLVFVDVACSQPLLVGVLTLNWVVNGGHLGEIGHFSMEELFCGKLHDHGSLLCQRDMNTTEAPPPPPLRCAKTLLSSVGIPDDVVTFLALCQAGSLYDHLQAKSGSKMTRMTRDEVKERLFRSWLFCKDHARYRLGRLLEAEFPTVTACIAALKRKDHRHAARLLQRVESALVVRGVVRRFAAARPGAYVGTIHDAVAVHEGDAEAVRSLLCGEFSKYGILPTVRIDRPAAGR